MSEQKLSTGKRLMINFFLMGLVSQTKRGLKKHGKTHYGDLLRMSYLVGKDESVIERMKFTNYEGDKILTLEEKQKVEKALSFNIHKEMIGDNESKLPCKNIFCVIDIKTKQIIVTWNYINDTKKQISL